MAGMLPGVECARRRRFYGSGPPTEPMSGGAHGWTRRPSFCLYISNNNEAPPSSFSRNKTNQAYRDDDDGKLGGAAREAKERLDDRLRNQKKPDRSIRPKREEKKQENVYGELSMEVFGPKKRGYGSSSGLRGPLRWFKWKLEEQEDCAICLDRFNSGETLVHLPCSHRFHSKCLLPWLRTNVHCPCCRKDVST